MTSQEYKKILNRYILNTMTMKKTIYSENMVYLSRVGTYTIVSKQGNKETITANALQFSFLFYSNTVNLTYSGKQDNKNNDLAN